MQRSGGKGSGHRRTRGNRDDKRGLESLSRVRISQNQSRRTSQKGGLVKYSTVL
jgi:hypothetical protein